MRNQEKDKSKVIDTLVKRIVSHEIPPGSALIDKEISEEFSISKWNIREVIHRIAEQGLVEIIPNRGVFVITLNFKTVIENLQIREFLEGLAARLAAQNSGPKDWERLVSYFDDDALELISKGEHKQYIENVLEFHEQIIKKADNAELSRMMNLIYNKTRMIIKRTAILPNRSNLSILEHREILDAIMRKEPDQAEYLNRQHLRNVMDCVMKYREFII